MLDKRLYNEVRNNFNYKFLMVMNGIASFITSFLQAFFIVNIPDGIFFKNQSFQAQMKWIIGLFIVILVKAILTFFFERAYRMTALKIKMSLISRYIEDMTVKSPVTERFQNTGTGTVTVCETAEYVEPYFYDYIPQLYTIVIFVPLILVSVIFYDLVSFLIMLFTAPLLPFFMILIGKAAERMNIKRLKSLTWLGGSFLDILNGMKTIKLFDRSKAFRERVYETSENFRKTTMEVLRVSFLSSFVLELVATISTAIIAVALGLRLLNGDMQFHTAFFILLLIPDYYMSIRKFGAKFHVGMSAKAAADNLYCSPPCDAKKESGRLKPDIDISTKDDLEITFCDVDYTYKNSSVQALKGMNLKIQSHKTTAIVGKSGAGKSTIAYVLLKFIEADSGRILVNGVDINNVDTQKLHSMISYVPQKPFIFYGSILENLCLAKPDADSADLDKAIEAAALKDFINSQQNGYDCAIGETGSTISIGEAQRIAVARAILKDTPLVIIDEATSALDVENEQLLKKSFENLCKDRTVLIIAHRLETVVNADRIYVLDKGCVLESGTHDQLMATGKAYRELVETWGCG